MAKFAAVRAQVSKMSQMMQLSSPGGEVSTTIIAQLIAEVPSMVAFMTGIQMLVNR